MGNVKTVWGGKKEKRLIKGRVDPGAATKKQNTKAKIVDSGGEIRSVR